MATAIPKTLSLTHFHTLVFGSNPGSREASANRFARAGIKLPAPPADATQPYIPSTLIEPTRKQYKAWLASEGGKNARIAIDRAKNRPKDRPRKKRAKRANGTDIVAAAAPAASPGWVEATGPMVERPRQPRGPYQRRAPEQGEAQRVATLLLRVAIELLNGKKE